MSSQSVSSIMSRVQQFYSEKKIFITGGTGFLGIILIEKLLRSCPKIETIYLLIREKKGKSVQERADALVANPIFNGLRNERPNFSKKIVAVSGDITAEGLGLSVADHARIVDEVSVIFHLAATVRFNERLDTAIKFNVCSVKSIIDVAKACKNLEAGIYVSTAYSNCVRKTINEELYPPPLSYDQITKFLENIRTEDWSEQDINNYAEKVLDDWPNTYSFTKAIAEGVVDDFAKDIPFAVFRPSIVMTSYREPVPGWVSSPFGFSGMICAIGVGLVHALQVDGDVNVDIVPVDYVCNALISCVWEIASIKRSPIENIPVYNYVSGTENPIPCKKLCYNIDTFGRIYPTNSAIYYPGVAKIKSTWILKLFQFFVQLIPALMIDSVARLFGKQLNLYKVELKIGEAVRAFAYFLTQQWNFKNERVQNLWKETTPEDKLIFPFSMRDFDWDDHVMKMVRGLRKYIVGDRDGNEEEARRRHLYLYIIHVIVRLAFGIFVVWMTWKLFSGLGLMIGN